MPSRLTKMSLSFSTGRIDNADLLGAELHLPIGTMASDTVALAYLARSEALFERLVGEFRLLLWDRRNQTLFAVSDSLGTRPIYYWTDGSMLSVASDVGSFLACREFDRTPDSDVVVDYLVGRFRSADRTFFRQAHRIPGGRYLVASRGGLVVRRYWYPPREDLRQMSVASSDERFRDLFRQAVRRRLVTDTPVLVHVSGGIDSTSIFSVAMQTPEAGSVRGVSAIHPGTSVRRIPIRRAHQQGAR